MRTERDEWVELGLDPEEMLRLSPSDRFGKYASARVTADLAALKARDDARAAAATGAAEPAPGGSGAGTPLGVGSGRWRRETGASAQLSVRLDLSEMAELRERAKAAGVGVSVLARMYLRQRLAVPVG